MSVVNLAWIIPLIITFSGAIYGFGKLVQRVSYLETNMDLLRDSIIKLKEALQVDDVGKRITRLEEAYSTSCKERNDHG